MPHSLTTLIQKQNPIRSCFLDHLRVHVIPLHPFCRVPVVSVRDQAREVGALVLARAGAVEKEESCGDCGNSNVEAGLGGKD
jgi:hypothetical protein